LLFRHERFWPLPSHINNFNAGEHLLVGHVVSSYINLLAREVIHSTMQLLTIYHNSYSNSMINGTHNYKLNNIFEVLDCKSEKAVKILS